MNPIGSSNGLVQESRTLAMPSILIFAKKHQEVDYRSTILMNDRLSFAVL